MKKILGIIVALSLVLVIAFAVPTQAKKKKVKLNKKKVTLEIGKKVTLKLKNNKKKVKWSSSNKKVATVKKGKVTAKKKGKATITAKVGKKKYRCKVTVILPKKVLEHIYTVHVAVNQTYTISEVEPYLVCKTRLVDIFTEVTDPKIKWKSTNKSVKVTGNSFIASETGNFTITGRAEEGVASKNKFNIKIEVHKKEMPKLDVTAIKKIEIMKTGVWVTITDEQKIRTLCEKINATQYLFNFERMNRKYDGWDYLVRFYDINGNSVGGDSFTGNHWDNYTAQNASDVMTYIASLFASGQN